MSNSGTEELIRILIYTFLFSQSSTTAPAGTTQIINFTDLPSGGISIYALYQVLSGSSRVWRLPAL
jgi:hypothetical protein